MVSNVSLPTVFLKRSVNKYIREQNTVEDILSLFFPLSLPPAHWPPYHHTFPPLLFFLFSMASLCSSLFPYLGDALWFPCLITSLDVIRNPSLSVYPISTPHSSNQYRFLFILYLFKFSLFLYIEIVNIFQHWCIIIPRMIF